MPESDWPIGIFDSGVGGLTVWRAISELLPCESTVYLGDTARVPYGTKSRDTVRAYARGCAEVLADQGVKLQVVACNTASAHAIEDLRDEFDIPVIGVVEPGARAAAAQTRNGRLGVIGTPSTIASGAYVRVIESLHTGASVEALACPLFVPLAEEGWVTGDVPEAVAREYLGRLREADIDTLVLGCTHYPMLRETIGRVMGDGVTLVDSATETAQVVRDTLAAMQLGSAQSAPLHTFLATDSPESFRRTGEAFLGRELGPVQWVDLRACQKSP